MDANIVTEESALLGPKEVDVYDHFSPARKRVILALVSFCGLAACELYPTTSQYLLLNFTHSVRFWFFRTVYSSDSSRSQNHRFRCEVCASFRFPHFHKFIIISI